MCYKLKFLFGLLIVQLFFQTFVLCLPVPISSPIREKNEHKIKKRSVPTALRIINVVQLLVLRITAFFIGASVGSRIVDRFNDGNISKIDEQPTIHRSTPSFQENKNKKTPFEIIYRIRRSIHNDTANATPIRTVRAVPAFVVPLAQATARLAGWTMAMIAAGAATSSIDTALKEESMRRQMIKKTFACNLNNFGCVSNLCWANCGPRINEADWCLTTMKKKTTKNNNETAMELAACNKDSDCDPCMPCGGTCILVDQTNTHDYTAEGRN